MINRIRPIENTYQVYGMLAAYDFLVSWFAKTNNHFQIQTEDDVFLLDLVGKNHFYTEKEMKKAVQQKFHLHFKNANKGEL
ncbi:hypothetical protein [Neobacillus vireti]|nr:hypothetical protein [Neobacillus vireti]